MRVKVSDPTNETIIDKVQYIADQSYDLMEGIDDSEYVIKGKFKCAIVDTVFYVSLAEGAGDYATNYDWSCARKNAIALKAMHRLADRLGYVRIKPEIMVAIDKLVKEIDYNNQQAEDNLKEREKLELESWLKKYKLWKEMQ